MTGSDAIDIGPAPRTSVKWRLIVLVVLLILVAPASWMARRVASKMEFFHLRSIAVEGTRYLSPEVVVERLAVDTLRSVWDDTDPLAERLRSMPQVSDVKISRKLPGSLVVAIRENLPVALAPSARGFDAVDTSGTVLPIDPTVDDLDLPLALQRDIAILALLGDIRSDDPVLYRRISEISRDGMAGIVLKLVPLAGSRLNVPDSTPGSFATAPSRRLLRVRVPMGVSVTRLADIFPVESDLVRRRANFAELDLRYRDQVIARLQ